MSAPQPEFLRFTSHRSLAQRLILATLTGRAIHISQIRPSSPTQPGLAPHEVSFLRLLDTITNGSVIQISYTGTALSYIPGLLTGGFANSSGIDKMVICTLPATCRRGVSWFLHGLSLLGTFSQAPLQVRFEGPGVITSATTCGDVSVDTMRTALLPLYTNFGIVPSKLDIRVLQRSCAGPGGVGGAGVVEFRFACQLRLPKTLHLHRCPGRVRRVRGVAYCISVSASGNARMIHAAREVLNPLLCDINIAAQYDPASLVSVADDSASKKRLGIGFGLSLLAETSSDGVIYSADVSSPSEGGTTPEEIGRKCALQLLEVISQGGCVSRIGVVTVLTMMIMGSEDIGRVRLGREVLATEEVIMLARDVKKFGASSWGFREVEDDESGDIIVSVKGTGIGNVGKKIA